MSRARRLVAALLLAAIGASLAGCATPRRVAPSTDGMSVARDPRDPMETLNRAVFGFNEALDTLAVKPVAQAYRAVVPSLVRQGVDNVFGNLGDVWSAVNQLLQGKPRQALEMGMRVGSNTVFGIGGLFDVATDMGLERQSEDFGQTLGHWGVPAGAYVMLPVLGPSTLRDSLALPIDLAAGPPTVFPAGSDRYAATGLQFLAARARLLGATSALDEAAFDKYVLLRDATFARRRNLVWDGDPPDDPVPAAPADAAAKP